MLRQKHILKEASDEDFNSMPDSEYAAVFDANSDPSIICQFPTDLTHGIRQ